MAPRSKAHSASALDAADRRVLDANLARLADGDRDAFDAVYDAVAPTLSAFVGRALPAQDADDVAQTALLKVFERASDYDASRPALPWILGIAGWEIRSHRRRVHRRREAPIEGAGELALDRADPEHEALQRELLELADALLSDLSSADREAIRAALGLGERPPTAAATFRKRVSRAFARLRSAFEEAHDA